MHLPVWAARCQNNLSNSSREFRMQEFNLWHCERAMNANRRRLVFQTTALTGIDYWRSKLPDSATLNTFHCKWTLIQSDFMQPLYEVVWRMSKRTFCVKGRFDWIRGARVGDVEIESQEPYQITAGATLHRMKCMWDFARRQNRVVQNWRQMATLRHDMPPLAAACRCRRRRFSALFAHTRSNVAKSEKTTSNWHTSYDVVWMSIISAPKKAKTTIHNEFVGSVIAACFICHRTANIARLLSGWLSRFLKTSRSHTHSHSLFG